MCETSNFWKNIKSLASLILTFKLIRQTQSLTLSWLGRIHNLCSCGVPCGVLTLIIVYFAKKETSSLFNDLFINTRPSRRKNSLEAKNCHTKMRKFIISFDSIFLWKHPSQRNRKIFPIHCNICTLCKTNIFCAIFPKN